MPFRCRVPVPAQAIDGTGFRGPATEPVALDGPERWASDGPDKARPRTVAGKGPCGELPVMVRRSAASAEICLSTDRRIGALSHGGDRDVKRW